MGSENISLDRRRRWASAGSNRRSCRLAKTLRLGDEAGRILRAKRIGRVARLHIYQLLGRPVRREEKHAAELIDVASAYMIAAPAKAADLRPVLAAAVLEPLNAPDGYDWLERAPPNRAPGAVETRAQAAAAA